MADIPRLVLAAALGHRREQRYVHFEKADCAHVLGDLHGVPLKDSLRSMISMYRFHERDAIAFEKSQRFRFMNPWYPQHLKPYRYASTAYWYQDRAVELNGKLQTDQLMSMYRRRDTDRLSYP